MTAPLTLYIIRHGEVHNPDHILYGRMPNFYLSDTGRGQASAAGQHLANIEVDAIFTSPLERAQETAGIIANTQNQIIDVQTDERIIECYTPYDGTSQEELDKIHFDLYTGTDDKYEKPRDLRRRLLDFIASVRDKYPNGTVIAVTHGDIVVSAFMHAKEQEENDIGRHRDDTERLRLLQLGLPEAYPATASISMLTYTSDDPHEVPAYEYTRPY